MVSLSSALKHCVQAILLSVVLFVIILILPGLPPYNVQFSSFYISPSRPLTGTLMLNNLLNNAERLLENKIKGPEAFAVVDGALYTGLHGGYVVKINDFESQPVVKFGKPCNGWWEEHICGRPLGLEATSDNHLVVADAYYGIFKYNVKTGKVSTLVSKDEVIEGRKARIFNSVAVGKDGSIYWTDSSSDFPLYNGLYTLLADPSGRLIKYDPVTKRNSVLLDNIYFANGVALSQDEDFVLVAETGSGRIRKVNLKGPEERRHEIFADGLPGLPDNLRPNGKGGFFVTLNVARDGSNPSFLEYLAPLPLVRKILARMIAVGDYSLELMDRIYPSHLTKAAMHFLGHFEMLRAFLPSRTTFLELDSSGKIIKSYHGSDGSISSISDIIFHNGSLYLGSPYNSYLGKIKMGQ